LIVRKASVVSLPPFAGRGIARELGIRRAVRFRMAAAVARGLIQSCRGVLRTARRRMMPTPALAGWLSLPQAAR